MRRLSPWSSSSFTGPGTQNGRGTIFKALASHSDCGTAWPGRDWWGLPVRQRGQQSFLNGRVIFLAEMVRPVPGAIFSEN